MGIPSVIAGACLSLRGAAVATPATADRATRDCENFILAIEDLKGWGSWKIVIKYEGEIFEGRQETGDRVVL